MLRFLDAGESHGKCLTAILEGFPANIELNIENIDAQLARRQKGYGRGKRMAIESDRIEIISGVRGGKTTGAPICLMVRNKDYDSWRDIMNVSEVYGEKIIIPRPGHADLNGSLKYNLDDIRDVIERASARQTAIRVAIGAISMELLKLFNVKIVNRVKKIGSIEDNSPVDMSLDDIVNKVEGSIVRCYDKRSEGKMIAAIDEAGEQGDTLGGTVEVTAHGVPCGLGSYASYDRKMDSIIAGALMSIQGVKAVEFGDGIQASGMMGSKANDEITMKENHFSRASNYAGGIEGGITNGMPIVVSVYMKPIPTTKKGIGTVDLNGGTRISRYERSDVCAVPALGVICENVMAFELAKAFVDKFPGDSIDEIRNSYDYYLKRIARG